MDADADHGCHERIMLFCVDEHAVQAIAVEDTVIDTLRGSPLVIDLLISICAAWDFRIKPDVPFRPGLNDPPIFGSRAAVSAFGAVFFSVRAAPHEVTGGSVITIGLHAQLFLTQGSAVFVDRDGIRDRFWAAAFIVQVDKGPYPPALKKAVGGIIVHCGVQADVFNGNSRHMFFQFMESDQKADGIMPPRAGKTQKKRDVRVEPAVMAGQLEQSVAEVILIQVTVPAPGSIGIREMAEVIRSAMPVMAKRAGMSMYGSAIAGDSKVSRRNDAALQGRKDGHKVEEALQAFFKVKRDVPACQETVFDHFSDFRLCLLSFLMFSFGFIRLFGVP